MATGKVKWFNNAKGYGFILPDQGGDDLFAHYSTIQMEGYKTLRAGQDVTFDIEVGPKGLHAVNVHAAAEVLAMPRIETSQITRPSLRSAEMMEPETA